MEIRQDAPPPPKVRVLGWDVAVEVREDNDAHLDDKYGYCDHRRNSVVLSARQDRHQMREALLHELFHVLEYATRTDLGEEEVGRLVRALYTMLRDNPTLVAWLFTEVSE